MNETTFVNRCIHIWHHIVRWHYHSDFNSHFRYVPKRTNILDVQQGNMQNPLSRSHFPRSHSEVQGQMLQNCVCSIVFKYEGYSWKLGQLLTSSRRCAETTFHLSVRHKIMSTLYLPEALNDFFMKLGSDVHHNIVTSCFMKQGICTIL